MNYSLKVNKSNMKEGSIKGFASIVFGNTFKVIGIKILENSKDGNLFVSMPAYPSKSSEKTVYKDICNPITKEFREELYGNILNLFNKINEEKIEETEEKFGTEEIPEIGVEVTPYQKEDSNLRGFVHIFIEKSFVINTISILQGKDKLFITMPSYKTNKKDKNGKSKYQEICYPITKESREELYGKIFGEYGKIKQEIL